MTEIRRNQILHLLKIHKKMSNHKLEKELAISSSTLRREILELEKEGLVRRYRGGVVLEVEKNHVISTNYRENVMIKEKMYIADVASIFIGSGMCIFVDSSSTVKALLPYISNLSNMVIITNGLNTAYKLLQTCRSDNRVYIIGGEAIKDAESVIGDYGNDFLKLFRIDLCLFSSTGIDEHGIYEANFSQALFKKKVMNLANKKILLVDHSKFGKTHAYRFSDWDQFDHIITDNKTDKKYIKIAKKNNTELLF
ncbi:DeoR/GlpR family DNA-binding transcription regulator [Enterococcus cecorum]|uniref:Lactose phosphotransferase system repressor n=1 Tax=Enterococcus cecorum TaxID=44008 RepID=A0A0J0B374_9ENTE|nr:DeoR/GlpR family DNA-binding transcription regulator [Enterococcus cecorum]KLO72648.1 hypothetical protein AA989_08935 [Enterococcus cecorum]KLO73037.1 hypothetical protein AA987_00385 [Enterococcus cecorum]OUQ10222.1 hypothetical protein B5E88_06635 [Enterococcus cecorum]CAI3274812.1 DeoR/GlpR transcriptional regulator [Enterococcus cecorum]CAI3288249.1 DeoR/GlpR transcriptional regulator [Enterococcus cecorum]